MTWLLLRAILLLVVRARVVTLLWLRGHLASLGRLGAYLVLVLNQLLLPRVGSAYRTRLVYRPAARVPA